MSMPIHTVVPSPRFFRCAYSFGPVQDMEATFYVGEPASYDARLWDWICYHLADHTTFIADGI